MKNEKLLAIARNVDAFATARGENKLPNFSNRAPTPGFRTPSNKAKKYKSTSLAMNIAIRLGHMQPLTWEGSARGDAKRKRRKKTREEIRVNTAKRLTNWQNHQWIKAKREAIQRREPQPIAEEFLKLVKHKQQEINHHV